MLTPAAGAAATGASPLNKHVQKPGPARIGLGYRLENGGIGANLAVIAAGQIPTGDRAAELLRPA